MTGIFDIPAADYHADQVTDVPTLSASIAHVLVAQSPLHAWHAHPKLNPAWQPLEPKDEQKYAVGTAAHALLLQGENAVEIIGFDNWRTREAQALRDDARANGKVPLLAKDALRVHELVSAVEEQVPGIHATPPLLRDGRAERTLVWGEDGGVVCRARTDWLRDDFTAIDDLKTTAKSAHPSAYSRALYSVGGEIQASLYIRGIEKITGVRPAFRWIVVEAAPPYAVTALEPGPDVLALGNDKVERAIELWRRCLESSEWPGYPPFVATAEMPGYEEARWMEVREAA